MSPPTSKILSGYSGLVDGISDLLEAARRASARAVNALMTAAYWEIGRRIVEFEQCGKKRAGYCQEVLSRLSVDLTSRFGRGFGVDNLELFRSFYLTYSPGYISETLSRKSESPHRKLRASGTLERKSESLIRNFSPGQIAELFPLSWTHYIHGLPNKILAREYKLALPDVKMLARELEKTRQALETHHR